MLNFNSLGEGPPIFVIHGLFGSLRNWQGHGKYLARDHKVYLLDVRNHGASPWSDDMSYHALAADLLALMDKEGLEQVRLLGHSMGGKIAMAAALLEPSRFSQMIIVDVAPVAYTHSFDQIIEPMLAIDFTQLDSRQKVAAEMAKSLSDPSLRAFLLQNLDTGTEPMRWRINLAAIKACMPQITGWPEDLADRVFDGSTLFLRGGASDYVDQAYHPQIARHFPDHYLQTIDGAGHWLHAEAPTKTRTHIREFLSQN